MMMMTRFLQLFCLAFCSLTIIITACTNNARAYQNQNQNKYEVPKTIVYSAVSKGAVCLDGSPPAYHFSPGFEEGAANWIVHLSGGGWCTSIEDCVNRTMDRQKGLGSSKLMNATYAFEGIFSKNRTANPDFYNWNKVFVRYCDGGSFTGDVEYVDPATNLHFRGARILPAILEDLLPKGLRDAKNAILSGGSAGAYPAMLYCDRFKKILPKTERVKCLVDSGYFVHLTNPEIAKAFESIYKSLVTLHGSAKALPKSCTSKMKPELCLFAQNIQQDIKTPLFIFMSQFDNAMTTYTLPGQGIYECIQERNCNASQIKPLKEIRRDFLNAIPKGDNRKLRGVFIDSVHHHTSLFSKWTPEKQIVVHNLSAQKGFANWYFDRSYTYLIDYEHELPLPNFY